MDSPWSGGRASDELAMLLADLDARKSCSACSMEKRVTLFSTPDKPHTGYTDNTSMLKKDKTKESTIW